MEHPEFFIDLPEDVEVGELPGTLLVARDPRGASPFRANLTVVAEQVPPGFGLAEYTAAGLDQAVDAIPGFRLIDRAEATLAGLPAERTLATYLAGPVSVTLEQWRAIAGDRAWVVSCSCDTAEYFKAADVWSACAESLELRA
jgi:hypothetical protein